MKVCIIGGTGHIGSFLVPLLVRQGHKVTVVASGQTPVPWGPEWGHTHVVQGRYLCNDEAWKQLIAGLEAETIVDILGVDLPGVYEASRASCRHLIACGSIWMLGPPQVVPTPPATQGPCEFSGYALRYEEIQATKHRAKAEGVAFTALMPVSFFGPGKVPLDYMGSWDIEVHRKMAQGKPAILPKGCNTLVEPCDILDIANAFFLAIENREEAADEILNVGSACALTFPRFIEVYSEMYGVVIPVEYVPARKFYEEVLPDSFSNFHFRHHMCPDITLTERKLGYRPEFTPEATMERTVRWLRDQKLL